MKNLFSFFWVPVIFFLVASSCSQQKNVFGVSNLPHPQSKKLPQILLIKSSNDLAWGAFSVEEVTSSFSSRIDIFNSFEHKDSAALLEPLSRNFDLILVDYGNAKKYFDRAAPKSLQSKIVYLGEAPPSGLRISKNSLVALRKSLCTNSSSTFCEELRKGGNLFNRALTPFHLEIHWDDFLRSYLSGNTKLEELKFSTDYVEIALSNALLTDEDRKNFKAKELFVLKALQEGF